MKTLKPIGTFIIPNGPNGVSHPQPYFAIRYNRNFAHLSVREVGWQILVESIGGLAWINIQTNWLCTVTPAIDFSKKWVSSEYQYT